MAPSAGCETRTWSISMSLGNAFGHSMATLTMSDGGGMVGVGGRLPHPCLFVARSPLDVISFKSEGEKEWQD